MKNPYPPATLAQVKRLRKYAKDKKIKESEISRFLDVDGNLNCYHYQGKNLIQFRINRHGSKF